MRIWVFIEQLIIYGDRLVILLLIFINMSQFPHKGIFVFRQSSTCLIYERECFGKAIIVEKKIYNVETYFQRKFIGIEQVVDIRHSTHKIRTNQCNLRLNKKSIGCMAMYLIDLTFCLIDTIKTQQISGPAHQ